MLKEEAKGGGKEGGGEWLMETFSEGPFMHATDMVKHPHHIPSNESLNTNPV